MEGGGPDARPAATAAAAEPEPAKPAPGLRPSRGRRHRLPRALQPARPAPAQLREHKRPPALPARRHLQRSQVLYLYSPEFILLWRCVCVACTGTGTCTPRSKPLVQQPVSCMNPCACHLRLAYVKHNALAARFAFMASFRFVSVLQFNCMV